MGLIGSVIEACNPCSFWMRVNIRSLFPMFQSTRPATSQSCVILLATAVRVLAHGVVVPNVVPATALISATELSQPRPGAATGVPGPPGVPAYSEKILL